MVVPFRYSIILWAILAGFLVWRELPRLTTDVTRLPGARILDGRFTAIQQAIGTPKARTAAAACLREFVADIKASGLVASLIQKHNVTGITVAA